MGMSREEAIRCLSVHSSTNGSGLCTDKQHYEAKQMAIKALEQEPCENAISRQAALDEIISRLGISDEKYLLESERYIYQIIKDLPPVTPKQRTGHWIVHPKGVYAHLVCDRCLTRAPYDCKTNYCPTCGIKMIEPQESEE